MFLSKSVLNHKKCYIEYKIAYPIVLLYLILCISIIPARLEPTEITFNISMTKYHERICDHSFESIKENIYTVLEEEGVKLITEPVGFDSVRCKEIHEELDRFKSTKLTNFTKFLVYKSGIWQCTVTKNSIHVDCYMKIHIRKQFAPQTILVDNIYLTTDRADVSVKGVDFTSKYEYGDGDEINISCMDVRERAVLSLHFNYVDIYTNRLNGERSNRSDSYALWNDQSSKWQIKRMRTKLHSIHNNTYLICSHKDAVSETKLKLKFVMRNKFNNIANMQINGMIVRPKFEGDRFQVSAFDYIFEPNEKLNIVLQVAEGLDAKLVDLIYEPDSNNRYKVFNVTETDRKLEVSFAPSVGMTLKWTARSKAMSIKEVINISFRGNFYAPTNPCKINLELPSNGTTIELAAETYLPSWDYVRIVYYEFQPGEKFTVNCYAQSHCTKEPIMSLQTENGLEKMIGRNFLNLSLTSEYDKASLICKSNNRFKTQVIFREILPSKQLNSFFKRNVYESNTYLYIIAAAGIGIIMFVLVAVVVIRRRRNKRQSVPPIVIDPSTVFYQNLLIGAFEPEIESNLEQEPHYEEVS